MPGGGFFKRLLPLVITAFVFVMGLPGSTICFGMGRAGTGDYEPDAASYPDPSYSDSSYPGRSSSSPSASDTSAQESYAPDPIQTADSSDLGFTCTEANGNVLGCTNLPSSCSKWWPSCSRQSHIGNSSIPSSCKQAAFNVIQYANGGGAVAETPKSTSSSQSASAWSANNGPSKNDLGSSQSSTVSVSVQKPGSQAATQSPAAQATSGTASPAADTGVNTPSAPALDQAGPSQSAVAAASRGIVGASEVGGGAAPVIEGSAATRSADPAAGASAAASYSDPALSYAIASGSQESLVQTLKANPEMREQLRAKLRAAANATVAASDPGQKEKIEYYKKVLAEADARSHGGTLDALTPLGAREAFSMNGEDSEREIHRLTASMGATEDELTATPLFPRVHQAILRQLAKGSVKFVPKRTLSAGN